MASENAHAALVNEDGIVQNIIVIPYMNDNDDDITAYCNGIGLEGRWLDTSLHGARRGKYAEAGDRYDADLNAFVAPKAIEPSHNGQVFIPVIPVSPEPTN